MATVLNKFADQTPTPVKYRPRNDQVLIRIVPVDKVRGLFMPQASVQGKQYVVEAVGPAASCEGLKKGDVVYVKSGKKDLQGNDTEVGMLPNENDLLSAPQHLVYLVVEPEAEAG